MTEQTKEAAERSAHVTRGPERAAAECPVVEVAPGRFQLRRVAELEAEVARLRAEIADVRKALADTHGEPVL